MIKNIIIMLMLCASYAHADDYDNFNSDGEDYSHFNNSADDKYRDWKNVLSLLAAKGVDTNSVDWNAVSDSCSNIQNKISGNAYNKCKYNNAINYGLYQKDTAYCDATAQQKYFDYMKQGDGGTTINNSVQGNNNSGNTKTHLNKREEQEFKDSAAVVCMRANGWNDSASWASGKSDMTKRRYKNNKKINTHKKHDE